MKARGRTLLWGSVLIACAIGAIVTREPAAPGSSLTMRLAGPLAGPLAAAQWVRVDLAIRAGRTELALARAETAFELNPTSGSGWYFLSRHLGLDLASPEREPNAEVRRRWVRAALAIAARGEARAEDPAELAFWQGLLLARTGEVDPQIGWAGGTSALWTEAAEHFERAARLGHPDGTRAAEQALRVRGAR